MATFEFHGADLVTYFNSNPANVAVDHYLIEYVCRDSTVTHRVDQAAHQKEASSGVRSYQDTLTYAENQSAGLTRNVRVKVYAVGDAGQSLPDVDDAQNSLPVLPSAPQITSTLTGVEISVPTPSDGDFKGFVAWVHTDSNVPMDDAHERYRGAANAIALQLPDDATYYIRIAPYDDFGLDTASAWPSQPIKRGDLNNAVSNAPVVRDIAAAQNAIKQDVEKAQREVADAKESLNAEVGKARTEAGQARSDAAAASAQAAQVRTDLVPTIAAAKKAGTDASAEATTVRDNLAAEVSRAKGEEGTLSSRIVTAQGRADAAHTAITEETTQRATADTALSNRASTVEAKLAGSQDSELAARIRAEETARVAADNAVAARTSVVEASYARAVKVLDNGNFDNGLDGWERFGASVVVASSYGRANVVRTPTGAVLNNVIGRRYTVKSSDQRFRLSASLRCAAGVSRYYVGAIFFDSDDNIVAARDGTGNYPLGAGYDLNSAIHGWLDRTIVIGEGLNYNSDFGGSCNIPSGTRYFRPILFINYLGNTESITEVDYFTVEDVSEAVATNARLTVEETARSTADTALANRLTTTEAKLSGSQDSELAARIRSEETARVATDNALAIRNTSLEAKFNSSSDRRSMTVNADTFVAVSLGDPALLPSGGVYGSTVSYGPHVEFNTSAASLRAVAPVGRTSQSYKLRARLWQTGGPPTNALWYADFMDGNYNRVGTALIGAWHSIENYSLQTLDREWTYTPTATEVVYIRFSVLVNRLPSNPGPETVPSATTRVLEASVENVSTVRAADAATNARITAEETARSTADSAIANRTAALEAQMNDTSDSWLRARIREEATARADGDNAIASRASTLEAQFRGEQASALKTLIDAGKNNLAITDWWKAGAGIPWPQSSGENQIYTVPDFQNAWDLTAPDGNSGDVWLCRATGTDAGGGWNAGKSVRLDPDKTYRFTIPIAQLDRIPRHSYWGTDNVCELNTGTHNPNPYFAVMGMNEPNRWYLFVGYIFPRNSSSKTHAGAGVWDTVTGEKVVSGTNYCFNPDGRQPDFRAYQYYTTPGTYQAFGRPLIECVDGSESNFANAFKAIKQARAADARIAVEETTRANADSAIANRLATTEAQFRREVPSTLNNTVHALELENVNRLNSIVAANARITLEETTRANADSAISNRVATTEAQFRREVASPLNTTVDSLVEANDYRYREIIQTNTRITNEETTRANADSALGNRISTVEASYVTQSQLRVSDMDLHFDAHIPANDAWSPNVYGTGTLDGRITKTVAWNSVSCLYWGVHGGAAEVYSRKTIPVDPSRKYRLKARFGTWNNGSSGHPSRFYIGFVGIDAYGNVLDHSPNGTYRYAVCPGELIIDGNIVERSVVVTGEGNDSLLKFPPGTRQIRLLIFLNYSGDPVASYVDYFTIEEVTEVDAQVSEEATARANADSALASRTNLLEGQVSGANDSYVFARLRNEETARANADSGLANRTAVLEAQINDTSDSWLRARIREEATARADADSALATRSTNLESRAGNVESRVSTTEGAISNLNGRSAAYWQVEAAAGGRARLRAYADNYGSAIDIAADQVYLGNQRTLAVENGRVTIAGDLYAGNGRIIMDNGTVMKVQGTGFGSANQFIEWFGPRQTNLSNCTESNATYYLKTNGSAYFGGALSAGVIKNSVQTTATIGTANVTTGQFGSNGGSRIITVGYTASGQEAIQSACPPYYTPYARIRLYRGTDANGSLLTEQQINGEHQCEPGYGWAEPGNIADQIGGSFTYTDNSGGSTAAYYVQIVARQFAGTLHQSLSLTSVEG